MAKKFSLKPLSMDTFIGDNMSLYFPNNKINLMVIVPANSEAIISSQRLGIAERCVGSYYASNLQKDVAVFLNHFVGEYIIDLVTSYYLCKALFDNLIAHCSSFYRDGLSSVKSGLDKIEANLHSKNDDRLLFSASGVSLTLSEKYLRIDGDTEYFSIFKSLILGEVIEIVFKKVGSMSYLIYLRPRGDILEWCQSYSLFNSWITEHTSK